MILINGILYVCRFTLTSDKEWFDKELLNVVTEVLGPEYSKMAEPNRVFVDFMRYCYHSSVWVIYPYECICGYSCIMYVGNLSLISVIRELLVLMSMNFNTVVLWDVQTSWHHISEDQRILCILFMCTFQIDFQLSNGVWQMWYVRYSIKRGKMGRIWIWN